jgi:hypothetical protein
MCSPKVPTPKKINPYEGLASDIDTKRAMDALGIDKIKKDGHKRKVDQFLLNERWDKEFNRKSFIRAYRTGINSGEIEGGDRTAWALNQTLGEEESFLSTQYSKDQAKKLRKQYKKDQRKGRKATAEQNKRMEELMNQPVYMPQQGAPPMVQKPQQKFNPILPAPVAPNPMQIGPPPAPELATTGNRMAIVRTARSTQARSRRATRGTSKLTNY